MAEEAVAYITYADSARDAGGVINIDSVLIERPSPEDVDSKIRLELRGSGGYLSRSWLTMSASLSKSLAHALLSVAEHRDIRRTEVSIQDVSPGTQGTRR